MSNWEHFQHQADIGVRGQGSTLSEAFKQAALALTAAVTDPEMVMQNRMIRIICRAPDEPSAGAEKLEWPGRGRRTEAARHPDPQLFDARRGREGPRPLQGRQRRGGCG